MKNITIFILILVNSAAFAQESSFHWKLDSKSDTAFWYSYHQDKLEYFDFPQVLNIESDFVFRFWRPFSCLEITNSANQLVGTLTFFIIESTDANNPPDIFVKSYSLPSVVANNLDSLLSSSQFDSLPSDKFIPGWEKGLDGVTFLFEGRDGPNWYFKNYWTPSTQENIPEATFLISLMTEIDGIIDYSNYLELFAVANPFTSYSYYGASYSVFQIIPKKELKKQKRQRNER